MLRERPKLPQNPTPAQYEAWRKACDAWGKQYNAEMDRNWDKEAKRMFQNRESLENAINTEILPTVVKIESSDGRTGMGFFRHSQWFVSNAHVIRHRADIDLGIELTDSKGFSIALDVEEAYHRPYDNNKAPDIVVLKTDSRAKGNFSCHSSNLFEHEQDTIEGEIFFYLDANFQVHFLSLQSKRGDVPLRFRCANGHLPKEGSSGSPIMSAKVLRGKEPKWIFKTEAALYARCKSDFITQERYVCGIPIEHEFKHIYDILVTIDSSVRLSMMAEAGRILGDQEKADQYASSSQTQARLADSKIKIFEAGASPLDIFLPDELEKLAGKAVVSLRRSMFIHSKKYRPRLTENEVVDLFESFINEMSQKSSVKFAIQDRLLENKYWRVDCAPAGSGKYWKLDLQDNIGGRGAKENGEPVSSIFGQIKFPKTMVFVLYGDIMGSLIRLVLNPFHVN